jgi:uncharacterized membrane protein YciS (DUF1049 family)
VSALRKLLILVVVIVFALAAAVFAYGNRGLISIDIGFARIDDVSMTVAFAVTFIIGAAFGLFCAAIAMFRISQERRQLRRRLRSVETELSSLRSAPLQDAN